MFNIKCSLRHGEKRYFIFKGDKQAYPFGFSSLTKAQAMLDRIA